MVGCGRAVFEARVQRAAHVSVCSAPILRTSQRRATETRGSLMMVMVIMVVVVVVVMVVMRMALVMMTMMIMGGGEGWDEVTGLVALDVTGRRPATKKKAWE